MEERQWVVLGLVVIGIVVLWYVANKPDVTSEYDARNFVINDATTKYPEAEIKVVSSNFTNNSWKMKVKATLGQNTPCPERIHLYYDYPALQFTTRPPEHITKNCEVCVNAPECILVFPEEALIASHTLSGTEVVKGFLEQTPEATGKASFLVSYGNYENVWQVEWGKWDGPEVQGIYAIMDKNGRVLEIGDWGSDSA